MKCIKSNHCECLEAGRPCTGSCPLANRCATVHQNPSTQWRQQAGTTQTFTAHVRRKPKSSTASQPTYCQVFCPFAFHYNNPNFSPNALSVGGVGPSPLDGAGSALTAPEITENATTTPGSATPTAIGGGNRISNLAPPTWLEVQELPSDTDSDVPSEDSSGAIDDDLTYLGWRGNFPATHDTTLDLSNIIEGVAIIHEVFN